jgi:SAM-dependent methyltransferase
VVKLDLGCGTGKKAGFVGVDIRPGPDVDQVVDLRQTWPWADGSVDEAHASHVVEHFTGPERIHFVNELHRVLKPGGQAAIVIPHWCSSRAYGDLTHQWPPVSEFWFYYLKREWRQKEAPHNDGYTCDFEVSWGFGQHPGLAGRSQEAIQFAWQFYKEAVYDMYATLTKR